ncbi:MAG: hypothetical protein AAF268_00585 [Cyanobacteria bacterium P01_A01_bin.3]
MAKLIQQGRQTCGVAAQEVGGSGVVIRTKHPGSDVAGTAIAVDSGGGIG